MGRLCYPTRHPVTIQLPRASGARKLSRCKPACRQAGRVWRTFCRPGTIFIEHYACRGTNLNGADKLSRYRIIIEGTGAVSRYKLSRSQKSVTMRDFNCGQMRALPTEAERRWVSGCNNHYKFVLSAGANKNRDKLIKHTVRVRCSGYLIFFP
jgi:hypothetical protein